MRAMSRRVLLVCVPLAGITGNLDAQTLNLAEEPLSVWAGRSANAKNQALEALYRQVLRSMRSSTDRFKTERESELDRFRANFIEVILIPELEDDDTEPLVLKVLDATRRENPSASVQEAILRYMTWRLEGLKPDLEPTLAMSDEDQRRELLQLEYDRVYADTREALGRARAALWEDAREVATLLPDGRMVIQEGTTILLVPATPGRLQRLEGRERQEVARILAHGDVQPTPYEPELAHNGGRESLYSGSCFRLKSRDSAAEAKTSWLALGGRLTYDDENYLHRRGQASRLTTHYWYRANLEEVRAEAPVQGKDGCWIVKVECTDGDCVDVTERLKDNDYRSDGFWLYLPSRGAAERVYELIHPGA